MLKKQLTIIYIPGYYIWSNEIKLVHSCPQKLIFSVETVTTNLVFNVSPKEEDEWSHKIKSIFLDTVEIHSPKLFALLLKGFLNDPYFFRLEARRLSY